MGKTTEKKGKKIAKRYYDRAFGRSQERGLSISEFGQQTKPDTVQSREIGGQVTCDFFAFMPFIHPE